MLIPNAKESRKVSIYARGLRPHGKPNLHAGYREQLACLDVRARAPDVAIRPANSDRECGKELQNSNGRNRALRVCANEIVTRRGFPFHARFMEPRHVQKLTNFLERCASARQAAVKGEVGIPRAEVRHHRKAFRSIGVVGQHHLDDACFIRMCGVESVTDSEGIDFRVPVRQARLADVEAF